ncbi:MAG: histidine kinase dimerization/phospho-acceptor domain-containing protein, partial [Geminicoccales bacterium]
MTMLEPSDSATRAPARAEGGPAAASAVAENRPVAPRPVGAPRDAEPADGSSQQGHRTARGAGFADAGWSSDWRRLSHELRTPLNAILGNIELLLDGSAGPLPAPARACIGDIQVASRQLMGQLQPLLLLVQARTSAAPAPALALDLLELIRRASADRAAADRPPAERRGPCLMS